MDPKVANIDDLNEMYEFFAFYEAWENGVSVDSLIEEQMMQEQGNLETRIHELQLGLVDLIEASQKRGEELVRGAAGLAPRDAQLYCGQLSHTLGELKETADKQSHAYHLAEKTMDELSKKNIFLTSSAAKIRDLIKQRDRPFPFQSQIYAIGTAACKKIAERNR